METKALDRLLELHREAREALISGVKVKKIWTRLDEIDSFSKSSPLVPEVFEAYIMTAMPRRKRPSRVYRHIDRLKKLRLANGQGDEFEVFETFLQDHLGGLHITSHGYQTRLLGDVDAVEIYSGVQVLIEQIQKLGYPVFANSGTLLGLVRDKAPIAFDDDIDLAVLLDAETDEEAAAEFLTLSQKLKAAGIENDLPPTRAPILKLRRVADFQVDLFPAYGTDENYNVYPYARRNVRKSDVLPLKSCDVSGLPVPADAITLLEKNYGAGWQVPDPRFVFPWRAQNQKFKKLCAIIRAAYD